MTSVWLFKPSSHGRKMEGVGKVYGILSTANYGI